jgi:hypothetical protein
MRALAYSFLLALCLSIGFLPVPSADAAAPIELSLKVTDNPIIVGQTTTLQGYARHAAEGLPLQLLTREKSGWVVIRTSTVPQGRHYNFTVRPSAGVHSFRTRVVLKNGAKSRSNIVGVSVLRQTTLTYSVARSDDRYTVTGEVTAAAKSAEVHLQEFADDTWQDIQTAPAADSFELSAAYPYPRTLRLLVDGGRRWSLEIRSLPDPNVLHFNPIFGQPVMVNDDLTTGRDVVFEFAAEPGRFYSVLTTGSTEPLASWSFRDNNEVNGSTPYPRLFRAETVGAARLRFDGSTGSLNGNQVTVWSAVAAAISGGAGSTALSLAPGQYGNLRLTDVNCGSFDHLRFALDNGDNTQETPVYVEPANANSFSPTGSGTFDFELLCTDGTWDVFLLRSNTTTGDVSINIELVP